MDAKAYDEWYNTTHGKWVGSTELALIRKHLAPQKNESLLDVGCGTGYFTRNIAPFVAKADGVDLDDLRISYAQGASRSENYMLADATTLPFDDKSYDLVMAITSLGFMSDQRQALGEMIRVARRKVAVAVLNRNSSLWEVEGKNGGSGGYKGAHWHTKDELEAMIMDFGISKISFDSAISFLSGGLLARQIDRFVPRSLYKGAFLIASFELPS